jgi:hypothetical protein
MVIFDKNLSFVAEDEKILKLLLLYNRNERNYDECHQSKEMYSKDGNSHERRVSNTKKSYHRKQKEDSNRYPEYL